MHRNRVAALAALCALLAACSTKVDPGNPYDPGAPTSSQAKASVHGTLSSPDLANPGGIVLGLSTNNQLQKQATTGADGSFLIDGIEPGAYLLEARPDGFVPMQLPLTLTAGLKLELGTVKLTAQSGGNLATLTGTCTLKAATDNSGILVEAVGRSYTAVTDSSGAYRLQVIDGTYTLRFSKKDFVVGTLTNVVAVRAQEKALQAVVLDNDPATVQGHVDGENAAGGANPLAGAAVSLDSTGITGVTDPNGDFSLGGIPAGSYLVRVTKTGYEPQTQPVLNLIGHERRTLSAPFLATLERGSIDGTVALSDNSDASGIIVEVTGTSLSQVTNSTGKFSFARVLAGVYEVTARKDGYQRRVLSGAVTVHANSVASLGPAVTLARQGGAVSVLQGAYVNTRVITLVLSTAPNVTGFHASEDPAFLDASKGDLATDPYHPFVAQSAFTLTDHDGQHVVYVEFSDGQNKSQGQGQVVLDRLAPQQGTVQINGGGDYTNAAGGIVTLTLGAQDLPASGADAVSGLAFVQLSNDPGFTTSSTLAFNRSITWTLDTPAAEGRKSVYAKFIDGAGNRSAAAVIASVTLDTISPANASISLGGATTRSPIVTAQLSATDANAGSSFANLRVRLSNTPGFVGATYQPFDGALTWILSPGDGAKTVYAQFIDPAGNESLAVHADVLLDTQAPGAPQLSVVEGAYSRSAAVNLTLSATGGATTAEVSEDPAFGAGTQTFTLPASPQWTLLGEGLHTLYARFTDAAGNRSDRASAQVVLDTTAPLAVPPSVPAVTAVASIALVPPPAGEDFVQIAGDVVSPSGFVAATPNLPITVTLTSGDGVKNLDVTYKDLAGNTTPLTRLTVRLDTTAPVVTNFTATGKFADGAASTTAVASSGVTLDFSGQSDAGSGISLMQVSNLASLSDASWQPFTPSLAWTLTAGDGAKIIYARFRDAAGNQSSVVQSSSALSLQQTQPSNGSLAITSGAQATAASPVALTVSAVGAAEMALSSDNFASATTWVPYNTTASAALSAEGPVTLSVKFRNAARVEGALARASITYDHTAPLTAGWFLQLAGSLGGGGGTSTVYTSTPAIVAQLTAPPAGQGDVAALSFVQGSTCTAPGTFQPWSSAASFTLTGGDGAKQLCVWLRDAAGNVSASAISGSIVLDTTLPSGPAFTISGVKADGTASTTLTASSIVSLDLSLASDAGSGLSQMKVSNRSDLADASWQPYAAHVSWTLPAPDGAKTVYALFRDAAGNASAAAASGTITLDTTAPSAPSLSIVEPDARPSNGFTGATAVKLNITGDASAVTALVSESPSLSAPQQFTLPVSLASFTLGGTGARTVYCRVYDSAGNASPLVSASVTVVTAGPLLLAPSVSPLTANAASNGVVTLVLPAAGQDGVKIAGDIQSPATTFTAAAAGQSFVVTLTPGDGTKNLLVTYRDAADNTTALSAIPVLLDTHAPNTALFGITGTLADGTTSTSATASTAVSLDLSGQNDNQGGVTAVSGISLMKLSSRGDLADASWQPFVQGPAFTLPGSDGAKTLYAMFRDGAGNDSAIVQGAATILLAQTPPSNPVVRVTSGATATSTAVVPLTVSATGAAEYALSLDGFATAPSWKTIATAASVTLTDPDQVSKSIAVKFRNSARVESAVATTSIVYDHTSPSSSGWSMSLVGTLGDGLGTSTVFTTVSSVLVQLVPPSGGAGDVAQMALAAPASGSCAGAFTTPTWQPYAPSAPISLPGGDGAKTVCALFRDSAQNVAAATVSASITLDTTPPTSLDFAVHGQLGDGTDSTSLTATTAVSLDFSGESDASGIAFMKVSNLLGLTDAAWQPYTAHLAWTLPSGTSSRTVYALFRDSAGKVTAAAAQGTIAVDQTAPAAPTLALWENDARPQNGFTSGLTIRVQPTGDATAVRAVFGENPTFTGATSVSLPVNTTSLPSNLPTLTLGGAGVRAVYCKVFDAAGNASPVTSASVTVITQGPPALLPGISPNPANAASLRVVQLTMPAAGMDGVIITGDLTGSPVTQNTAPGSTVSVTLTTGDGKKNLAIQYRDAADNLTALPTQTVLLDTRAPAAVNFAVTGTLADGTTSSTATATTAVTLNFSGENDLVAGVTDVSGIAQMKISNRSDLADATLQPFVGTSSVPWTLPAGDSASRTVYAQFRDAAGNDSAIVQSSAGIAVAATPPSNPSVRVTSGATATSVAAVPLTVSASGAVEYALSLDNFTTAPSWTPIATAASVTLADPDQLTKTVSAKFRNAARVESAIATTGIFYDHTAPSLTSWALSLTGSLGSSLGSSTSLTASANVTATLTPPSAGPGDVAQVAVVQKSGASCNFGASPTWVAYGNPITVPLTGGDGPQTVCAALRDAAGNQASGALTASIVVDATVPSSSAFGVSGTRGDGTASSSVTVTPLVQLDFSGETDGAGSGIAFMKVWNSTDSESNAAWQTFQRSLQWTLSAGADGSRTVNAKFRDAAGNATSSAAAGSISLDATAPTGGSITLYESDTRNRNGFTNSTTVGLYPGTTDPSALTAQCSESPSLSGATTITLSTLPAGPFGSSGIPSGVPTLALGGTGTRIVYCRLYDAAMNAGGLLSASLAISTTGPLQTAPTFTPAAANLASAGNVVNGAGTVSMVLPAANEDGVQVTGNTTNASAFVPATAGSSVPVTLSAGDGTKSLTIKYRDVYDNLSSGISASLLQDTHVPTAVSFTATGTLGDGTPSTAYTATQSVALTFTATDDSSGSGTVTDVRVANKAQDLPGATWFAYTGSLDWTLSPGDGPKTVFAQFRDGAQNISTIVTSSVSPQLQLLQQPPSGGSILVDGGAPVTNNRYAQTIDLSAQVSGGGTPYQMWISTTGFQPGGGASSGPGDTGWVPYLPAWNAGRTPGYLGLDLLNGSAITASTHPYVVSVKFRNTALVEGGGATTSILYDGQPPTGGTLSLSGVTAQGGISPDFTTAPAITAFIAGEGGNPSEMAFAVTAFPTACNTSAAFAAPSWQPFAHSATVLLTGEGKKNVCVILRDDAQNQQPVASAASAAITVDTQAPSNPIFLSPAQGYTRSTQVLATFSAATDQSGSVTYQCLGGQFTHWTDCDPAASAFAGCALDYSSNFPLPQKSMYCLQPGDNLIGVRARDPAFNASGGTFIDVISEPTAPLPPIIQTAVASESSVALSWSASPTSTVTGYKVWYGTTVGDLSGSGAAQGNSPIDVGQATNGNLTGLLTGQTYYFQISAYDAAGNQSDLSGRRLVVPQKVGPRFLSNAGASLDDIALLGSHVYVSYVQGILQLDIGTDAAPPQIIGRAALPNGAPGSFHSLFATPCASSGSGPNDGECVLVAATDLETSARHIDGLNGLPSVTVMFFPTGGTSDQPVGGRVLTTISVGALLFIVSNDGKHLYTTDGSSLFDYLVGNPAAPVLLKKAPLPFTLTGGVGAGVIGNTFYGLLSSAAGASLITTDVSGSAFSFTTLPPPQDSTGAPVPFPGGQAFFGDALYFGYVLPDGAGGANYWLSRYTPSGPDYPKPDPGHTVLLRNSPTPYADHQGLGFNGLTAVRGVTPGPRIYAFGNSHQDSHGNSDGLFGIAVQDSASGMTTAALTGVSVSVKAVAAYGSGTVDHIMGIGSGNNSSTVQQVLRWVAVGGPALTTLQLQPFGEPLGVVTAYGEGMVFAASGFTIASLDVGNPLLPRTAASYTHPTRVAAPGTNYAMLKVHGGRLYASVQASGAPTQVDIFAISGDGASDGQLTLLGTALSAGVGNGGAAIAPTGKYLYGATGTVEVWDVTGNLSGGVASLANASALTGGRVISLLDARGRTAYTASNNGQNAYQAFSFTPGTGFAALAPFLEQPFGFFGATLNARAGVVTLSDANRTLALLQPGFGNVSWDPQLYSSGFGSRLQNGYVVGSGQSDGPRYSVFGTDELQGFSPYSNCGRQNDSTPPGFDTNGAVVYASCSDRGVQILSAVSPSRARLQKRWDGAVTQYTSMALANDGAFTYVGNAGAPTGGGVGLWAEDESHLAAGGTPSQPVYNQSANGVFQLDSMVTANGYLFGVARGNSTYSLNVLDVSNPSAATPWPYVAGVPLLLSGSRPPTATGQPVTDGSTLYVPWQDGSTDSGFFVIDIRDAFSPQLVKVVSAGSGLPSPQATLAVRSVDPRGSPYPPPRLGLQRQRLYLTTTAPDGTSDCRPWLFVWDVTNPAAPSARTPVAFPVVPGCGVGTGNVDFLGEPVPQGRFLFYVYRRFDAVFGSRYWGLGIARMGPQRDGASFAPVMDPSHGPWESQLALSGLNVTGDTAYARIHLGGLASFDLTPVFQSGRSARFLVSQGITDTSFDTSQNPYALPLSPVIIEGPWAIMLNGRLQVYDLR